MGYMTHGHWRCGRKGLKDVKNYICYETDTHSISMSEIVSDGAQIRCVVGLSWPMFSQVLFVPSAIHVAPCCGTVCTFLLRGCLPIPRMPRDIGHKSILHVRCQSGKQRTGNRTGNRGKGPAKDVGQRNAQVFGLTLGFGSLCTRHDWVPGCWARSSTCEVRRVPGTWVLVMDKVLVSGDEI